MHMDVDVDVERDMDMAHTLPDWIPSFLREFEAKLASAYHEWVKNARRSGKSIYHFSLICLCVCVGVRAWVCARV